MNHRIDDVIALFDGVFSAPYRTCLVSGDDEPLYRPAAHAEDLHRIIFAHGFFASALHEVSHWCIAGERHRQLEDYGYWYEPDGRDAERQREFEQVLLEKFGTRNGLETLIHMDDPSMIHGWPIDDPWMKSES